MTYLASLGYKFKLPGDPSTDGSIILASAMPLHQLERRRIDSRYPHMRNRLFDPQLYLAGLDATLCRKECLYLATYPCFGIEGLTTYSSSSYTQSSWRQTQERTIHQFWPGRPPTDDQTVRSSVEDSITMQQRLGCAAIILPSPLTTDPSTDYFTELKWLDFGIEAARRVSPDLPIFATLALSDLCLIYSDPTENRLLDLVLDAITAREVDGVYIVVEQANEPQHTRLCSSKRTLWSLLHLTHIFSNDASLKVGVNFMGFFGLVCRAVGADFWASGWYKSLIRLRLADKSSTGRAYPLYWSTRAGLDIHLEKDLDILHERSIFPRISEDTEAASGLHQALSDGQTVSSVPAWRYAISNVSSARHHFFESAQTADDRLKSVTPENRPPWVHSWLQQAVSTASVVDASLGGDRKTLTGHIRSWLAAYDSFREDHRL